MTYVIRKLFVSANGILIDLISFDIVLKFLKILHQNTHCENQTTTITQFDLLKIMFEKSYSLISHGVTKHYEHPL